VVLANFSCFEMKTTVDAIMIINKEIPCNRILFFPALSLISVVSADFS